MRLLFFCTVFQIISLLPLYSSDWDDLEEGENEKVYGSERSKKYPRSNLFYEMEKWENHYSVKALGIYRHYDYPKFESRTFFPFYHRLTSRIDSREKYRILNFSDTKNLSSRHKSFFPFVFWGEDKRDEYHSVFPLYYRSYSKPEDSEKRSSFFFAPFPMFYRNRSYAVHSENTHRETLHWNLFFYSRKAYDESAVSDRTHSSLLGFPLIPVLFYTNYNEGTGTYRRFLTLFHTETDEEGLQEASFFPLLFYKKESHISAPLLLFHKSLAPHSATAPYGNTFLLIYWHRWSPEKDTLFLGPYYSRENKIVKDRFRTLFPVYWSGESEKKEWSMILPLYINYNDKENDWHFNVFWYSRKGTGAVDPSLNIGKQKDTWYLDSSVTVIYGLFGISLRQPIEKPAFFRSVTERLKSSEEKDQEKKTAEEKAANDGPGLSKKRTFDREHSREFLGYSALFGLFSYEKGDTKRHVRLLPLAWLTWDEASDEKVTVIPPFPPIFFRYKTEDLEYFVVFPFYGKQRDKDSELSSVLLNMYIAEKHREKNREETSVIWPFFNKYSEDGANGHRLLPFYIQKNTENGTVKESRNYTLFSVYSNYKNEGSERKEFLIWPLLTYWSSENSKVYSSYTLWLTPFFYRSRDEYSARTNVLWFTDWKFQKNRSEKIEKEELSYLMIFPFYMNPQGRTYFLFPVFYLESRADGFSTFTLFNYINSRSGYFYYNLLFLAEYESSGPKTSADLLFRSFTAETDQNHFRTYGLYGLLWNFEKNKEWKHRNILWIGADNYSDTDYTYNFLPLYRIKRQGENRTRIYGPLLHYSDEDPGSLFMLGLLGLGYWHTNTESTNQHSTYILLGTLYREYTEKERGYISRGSLWGLLWEYQKEEETGFQKFSMLKLFSYTKEPDGTVKIMGIQF
ncbi:MAG TPA: hypothetical protein PL163_11165 [Leptospiraceae bacterium]|nr:hypothetical protein [Leptospiraceae bacterium]